jgi:hypothetical protein
LVEEYVDEVTGKNSDRQRMFEDASRRRFDVLLFWSLDRLSREGALETLQHLNRLTGYGVQWRSLTEQFLDSTGMFRDAVIRSCTHATTRSTRPGAAFYQKKGPPGSGCTVRLCCAFGTITAV